MRVQPTRSKVLIFVRRRRNADFQRRANIQEERVDFALDTGIGTAISLEDHPLLKNAFAAFLLYHNGLSGIFGICIDSFIFIN